MYIFTDIRHIANICSSSLRTQRNVHCALRNIYFVDIGKTLAKEELITEAVVQRCSAKKVFLEILQNSQENTCARVSFLIKLHA